METISRKDGTDFAWLAGLIDGDGCISLRKQRQPTTRNTRSEYYVPYISITTTCTTSKNYIERMFKEYDLPLYIRLKPSKSIHQKPVWILLVNGLLRVQKVLARVKPYLVTKQEEAKLVLDFITERQGLFAQKKRGPKELIIVKRLHEIKLSRNTVLNPQRLYAGLQTKKKI